ncbi:transcription termination factor 2 [Anthonomus grandis grandis]|uniref:transcription termination factor 2 n=1 Tax=Anthonomus grandis grandis TaxID=2921223 RepID=UPI002165D40F|nr:transcription termination factor 2 [Anthonomus grandis grandis]
MSDSDEYDESFSEEESINDSQGQEQDSMIFTHKKKLIKVIDSDSSSSETEEVVYANNSKNQIETVDSDDSSSNTPEKLYQIDSSNQVNNSSDSSLSETQEITHINDPCDKNDQTSAKHIEGLAIESQSIMSSKFSSMSNAASKLSSDQSGPLLAEDSNTEIIDATPESDEIDVPNNAQQPEVVQEKSKHNSGEEDILNLSDKMRKSRMTEQFSFFGEGILNSTSIHPIGETKNWRASNAKWDIQNNDSSDSVEIIDASSEIINLSSKEIIETPPESPIKPPKKKTTVQPTLKHFVLSPPKSFSRPKTPAKTENESSDQKQLVSRAQYEKQQEVVEKAEIDFVRLQSTVENVDMALLPDKGQIMKLRVKEAEHNFMKQQAKLNQMQISNDIVDNKPEEASANNIAWENIQAGADAVMPRTFGKQALSTLNAQKAVTLDRLQQLHGALLTCPKEDDLENDPKGIKVPLMPHQRRALAWLMFREKEKPSGGILADDMGLGKTLTMIALILKTLIIEREDKDSDYENRDEFIGKHTKFDGGSLIVCPASLINQWGGEIEKMLKHGMLSYNLYHGAKREKYPKELAKYDVVITTYAIIKNENEKRGPAFRVKWRRIILDEAHQIRNHKSQTSEACCQLAGKSRWALTGTPLHNKELDMYALLKFLRCSPFDDLQVWKRWVGDKSLGGSERLHTVISSLMLRRTKAELMQKGQLTALPEKKWLLVKVEMDESEQAVYHKVLIFSQTLFSQFLHQRAVKNQDYADFHGQGNNVHNEEYNKMREKLLKLNKVKNVSQHEILVLLLRLRQICCHPSLITAMLDDDIPDLDISDEDKEQLNILEQLKKLNLEDDEDVYKPEEAIAESVHVNKVNLKEATKGHLHPSDPVFAAERPSSKIKKMIKVLKTEVLSKGDKAIVVSQWPSYLRLLSDHLRNLGIEIDQLDGTVPVNKRQEMVNNFNNPKSSVKVLLLSLTAGGVGLNLVGANHLFLLDLHWNPQLENQAQDRIYRMGQNKPVFVYKFMTVDSIEERIKGLQDNKLAMAEGILTGTRQVDHNKLSIDDLKVLFNM